jgi:hypothetical protein
MLSIEKLLPLVMTFLSIGASIIYFAHGDVRRAIYWIAGAVLTAAVTF